MQAENALRTISLFQDVGLEPTAWIVDMPSVRIAAQMLNARVHIDDRNDVLTCFTLESIAQAVNRHDRDPSTDIDNTVPDALNLASEMPGNVRVVIGNEIYGDALDGYLHSRCRGAEAVNAIAQRIAAVSRHISMERVSA